MINQFPEKFHLKNLVNNNLSNEIKQKIIKTNKIISIENIISQKDRRTTVMLRNIPNKYTLNQLIEDTKEFNNKFDVLYLPLDYNNHCNLGFAFINFVDPFHIILFYETFIGKKWSRYLSEKICDMSYAKIQGKNDLMNHFEKSNIMRLKCYNKRPLILPTPNPLPKIELSLVNFH